MVWEFTWPSPEVVEPIFYRYDNREDDSSDDEESSDEEDNEEGDNDYQPVIILHPVGSLLTFPDNSDCIKGLSLNPVEKSRLPVALSVCHESREFTLQHYYHLYHRQVASPNFYFNPKRDILWFSDSRIHDHLSTLRCSYGDSLLKCMRILIDHSEWEDEKLRHDILRSLRVFSAVDTILISDRMAVRLDKEDDGFCFVPDSDKMIAQANRCRSEYERFLDAHILYVDCWGDFY